MPDVPASTKAILITAIATVLASGITTAGFVYVAVVPKLDTIEHSTNSQLTDLQSQLAAALADRETMSAVIIGLQDVIDEIRNPTAVIIPPPAPPE